MDPALKFHILLILFILSHIINTNCKEFCLYYMKMSNCVLLMTNILIIGRSIEMDHMKLSLVHDFIYIQSIGMIPLL
jgi:hypothetical protein